MCSIRSDLAYAELGFAGAMAAAAGSLMIRSGLLGGLQFVTDPLLRKNVGETNRGAMLLMAVLLCGLILAGCAGSVGVLYGEDYWATESYAYATPSPYYVYPYPVYPYPRSYSRPFNRPWSGYPRGYWGGNYRGGYRNLSPPFRSHQPRHSLPPPAAIPPQFRKG
jgi:hypothetical protein